MNRNRKGESCLDTQKNKGVAPESWVFHTPCCEEKFDASTKDYTGVRNEREEIPKKLEVIRFTSLPDTMHGIRCNKEMFLEDVMEHSHSGEKRWGLVFYGIKTKLMENYRLCSKDPTAH